MSIQATATLRPTAPSCEAKLRMFDTAGNLPPYCQRQIALGSFLDANGVRRFHCQAEGHREKVAQLYGVQARWALDAGEAVFDAPDPLAEADFRRDQLRDSFPCQSCGSPDPSIIRGRFCSDCKDFGGGVFA